MSSSDASQLRRERIATEVEKLRKLADENPSSIKIKEVSENSIILTLIVASYVYNGPKALLPPITAQEHMVHITFPADYLSNGIFGVEINPVLFHPNIFADGAWQADSPHVVEYIYKLWQYYTFRLVEQNMDDVHNEDALNWYKSVPPLQLPNGSLHLSSLTPSSNNVQALVVSSTVAIKDTQVAAPEADKGARLNIREARPSLVKQNESAAPAMRAQSGFRVKSPMRVTQPRMWSFPIQIWRTSQKTSYRNWSYSVPRYVAGGNKRLKVVILEPALQSILEHARGDIANERFGILVGGFFSDPQSGENWVEIVAMLPAERVSANIASVEVSTEEINRLNARVDVILAETQEAVRKIGWYHTHPGHGIFLSGTDQTNQRLCYGADWHVALVVDPINCRYGAFYSADCIPLSDGILVLSEQKAAELETPAYHMWRNIEDRGIVSKRSQPLQEDPRNFGRNREPEPNSAPPAATTLESEEGTPYGAPSSPPPVRTRIGRELGKMFPYPVPPLSFLALLLVLLFWLLFSLGQSNTTLANERVLSVQRINTIQKQSDEQKNISQQGQQQIQALQQQIKDTDQKNQDSQQQLRNMQQDLFNQGTNSGLDTTNPVLYRTILRTVVTIDSTTEMGKKATQLLKSDLFYTVVANDTLEGIAQKFGIDKKALQAANPHVKAEQLQIGQILKIPGQTI